MRTNLAQNFIIKLINANEVPNLKQFIIENKFIFVLPEFRKICAEVLNLTNADRCAEPFRDNKVTILMNELIGFADEFDRALNL